MVENIFDKYPDSIKELKDLKEVKFFAVVKMDDLTDRWSLLFGLTGAKDLDKRKLFFEKIREIIIKHFNKEDMQSVARIGLFATTDHLIKDLMSYPENQSISNIKANGNFIHEGYIIISDKPKSPKLATKDPDNTQEGRPVNS